jgi:hypothetical protein
MKPWQLGSRRLLAATCYKCGKLFSGTAYNRHLRNKRDRIPYVDRRCTNCKWGTRAKMAA